MVLQRAEDETARLYQEFVESFQGDLTPGSKAFVRGGTINPNDKLKTDSEGQCQCYNIFPFNSYDSFSFQLYIYSCFVSKMDK